MFENFQGKARCHATLLLLSCFDTARSCFFETLSSALLHFATGAGALLAPETLNLCQSLCLEAHVFRSLAHT